MAIRRVQRKRGPSYVVTWRESNRRQRSRSFDRKKDAEAFEAKIRIAKRRGDLDDLDAGKQKLADFLAEYWRLDAEPRLSPKTLALYKSWRARHIEPQLGKVELRRLTPERIVRFQAQLLADGVSGPTVHKLLVFLQGVLDRAVEWRKIQANPVRAVRKAKQPQRRTIHPLGPEEIEKLRGCLLKRDRRRDATLVAVLAYAGLRPGEALALTWGDVRQKTLLIDKAVAGGRVQGTKTRRTRTVNLLQPLAADLAEWRLTSGRPDDAALVFPTPAGNHWNAHDWQNWRNRVYVPAAEAVGLATKRPYDCRHAMTSLLLAEGRNPIEVAEQLGHSPTMTLDTYGHVIDELRGKPNAPAEARIRAARQRVAA